MKRSLFSFFIIALLLSCGFNGGKEMKGQYILTLQLKRLGNHNWEILRFSERGYYDDLSREYSPRITQPGSFSRYMFSSGKPYGAGPTSYGETKLSNLDGDLDYIATDYSSSEGYAELSFVEWDVNNPHQSIIVLRGNVSKIVNGWSSYSIQWADKLKELDKSFKFNYYEGTTIAGEGVEGVATQKGIIKPEIYGLVGIVPLVCVNPIKLIYQFNSRLDNSSQESNNGLNGVLNQIQDWQSDITGRNLTVCDQGIPIPLDENIDQYSSLQDLQDRSPAQNHYAVYTDGYSGYIRLGSTPSNGVNSSRLTVMSVNADWYRNSPFSLPGCIGFAIKRILWDKLQYQSYEYNNDELMSLNYLNIQGGVFLNKETTYRQVLDDLASSGLFWYGFDNQSVFRIGRLEDPNYETEGYPLKESVMTFTEFISINSSTKFMDTPLQKVVLNYNKNYNVMSSNDLALAVNLEDAILFTKEYRTNNVASIAGVPVYDLVMNSSCYLISTIDQPELLLRLFDFFDIIKTPFRLTLDIEVPVTLEVIQKIDLGKIITLKANRFGMNNGKRFIVTGMEPNYKRGTIKLQVWG